MKTSRLFFCFAIACTLQWSLPAQAQSVARNSDGRRTIDQSRCDKERAQRNCSGREACDASKKEYEQCKVYLQAELDQEKARKEAEYKAQKKQEIDAINKANKALERTQKLNGSKH